MPLSNQDIAAACLYELQQAMGYNADTLATNRQLALDYYNGLLPAAPYTTDPDTGETSPSGSGIVSMDVADCLHALLAQIQPIVKTTSVEFEPDSEQDEPQAQAESDLIRKILEREGGFSAVFGSCFDALLTGNGWIKVTLEEKTEVTEQCYPADLTPEQVSSLLQPRDDKETREIETEEDEGHICLIITRKAKKLICRAVPPENMFFSNQLSVGSIQDLTFVAEQMTFTESQLLELGISQATIDQIDDASAQYNPGQIAREGIYQNQGDLDSAQDAQRQKTVYVCFYRVDLDGSGKSELREIWIGGQEILVNESADYTPYINGSAIPLPHSVNGSGIFNLLAPIQNGKTHILRQYMDNLAVANLGRVAAVEGQVNMSDLLNGRANGVVRVKRLDSLLPLPSTDNGVQSMQGLNYLDQVRTARVGAAIDFNEAQAQLMASSATAAAGQLAKVEQMSGWFAENLVQTLIKPLFLITHKLLRSEVTDPVNAKLRGQWVQQIPAAWPERKNISIVLGMTSVERASKINALAQLIAQQHQLIQEGASDILVGMNNFYNSMSDWIRANNLSSPDQYLIDPSSPQSQQAAAAKTQAAQEQQQQVAQLQQSLLQMQHHFELLKQERDLSYKVWSDKLDAEVKEAEMTSSGMIEMEKLQSAAANEKASNLVDILVQGDNEGNGS